MTEYKPYWKKLKDPRWQKKRLEVMELHGFKCQNCEDLEGDKGVTLNVHHAWYEKGFEPWDYPVEAYQCLCEDCHARAEELRLAISKLLFTGLPHELDGALTGLRAIAALLASRHDPEASINALIEFAGINALPILMGYAVWSPLSVNKQMTLAQVNELRKLVMSDYREASFADVLGAPPKRATEDNGLHQRLTTGDLSVRRAVLIQSIREVA